MIREPSQAGPELVTGEHQGPLDPELARVVRLCDPGFPPARRLTFAATNSGDPVADWLTWRDECFRKILLPLMTATFTHARVGEAREIQALDLELDGKLPDPSRANSREAGRELLGQLAAARGVNLIVRLRAAALNDATPAHYPVIHAVQCALFHVPVLPCLLSYLFFEWKTAGLTNGSLAFGAMIESFRPVLAESIGVSCDEIFGQAAA